MDYTAFIITIIENFISSVPQFVTVLVVVLSSLNKINNNTLEFPTKVDETKKILGNAFKSAEKSLTDSFRNATKEMKDIMSNTIKEISEEVNGSLTVMQEELIGYKDQLVNTKNQMNELL